MSEPFVTPAALPCAYDAELLVILMEECAEVQQRASKILRFGAAETEPGQLLDNICRLSLEIGHLECMIDKLTDRGLISLWDVGAAVSEKEKKLAIYMQNKGPI